jgi:hypothetical protein
MSTQITVKHKNGKTSTYIKPNHCKISDEDWQMAGGYCWGFAIRQDEGDGQCTAFTKYCE